MNLNKTLLYKSVVRHKLCFLVTLAVQLPVCANGSFIFSFRGYLIIRDFSRSRQLDSYLFYQGNVVCMKVKFVYTLPPQNKMQAESSSAYPKAGYRLS